MMFGWAFVFGDNIRSFHKALYRLGKLAAAQRRSAMDLSAIEKLFDPDYADKDTMHDLTHIRRVHHSAVRLAENAGITCDGDVLRLGAYFHGVVYLDARVLELRRQLLQLGVADDIVDRAMEAARESQKGADAKSPEGIVLHDGHLLEGSRSFLLVKSLVTGAARGSSLAQIIEYWNSHDKADIRCVLPEAQIHFEEQVAFTRSVFAELAKDVALMF
jgi:uncharacterized protein